MNLGLGLALELQTMGLTPYQRLLKSATWAIDFSRPQGVKEADVASMNTRQINPTQDLVGNADVTMNQASWTTSDGFATAVAPNGKTVIGFKADGINTYGVLPSNAPNPVGTQDFAFAFVFKTGATLPAINCIYSRGDVGDTSSQISIYYNSSGNFYAFIENTFNVFKASVIEIDSFYKTLIVRKSGVLKVYINGVEVFSASNTLSLTSRQNSRLFARATSTGQDRFGNHILFKALYTDKDFTKFETEFNKYCAQEYGL